MPSHNKKALAILVGLLVIKMALPYFLINPVYDLHRDEYLHLDQAKHLAWGYVSVPPVTSWVSYLILLPGNSEFWVKFFPSLFGALTILVVWKTIEALQGNLFARVLGAVAVMFSVILRINLLLQPNSLDILLWTTGYFAIVKYIQSEKPKWLYFLAAAIGFAFLNKYNIVFMVMGLLPALLLTRHRKLFGSKHFYFAVLVALLLVSPNLIWQYQNGFPVVHHLNELAKTQLEKISRIDFLKEQLLFFIGSVLVLIAALISFFSYAPFKKYRLFFWAFIFTLAIFVYFRSKAYYAIGLYPVLLAFGSVYCEHLLSGKRKVYLRFIALALPVVLFIPLVKVAFPVNSPEVIRQNIQPFKKLGLLRWEDGKDHLLPQDFADMLGWQELARKVDSASYQLGDPEHTLVLCDNYGQAGAINFYSQLKNRQAVSFNADYLNWFPLEQKIKHIILVKDITDPDKDRAGQKKQFGTVYKFAEITNPYAREKGTVIYLLKNAKIDLNKFFKKAIAAENSQP